MKKKEQMLKNPFIIEYIIHSKSTVKNKISKKNNVSAWLELISRDRALMHMTPTSHYFRLQVINEHRGSTNAEYRLDRRKHTVLQVCVLHMMHNVVIHGSSSYMIIRTVLPRNDVEASMIYVYIMTVLRNVASSG